MSYLGSQFQRSGAYKKLEMVQSWKTKQNMRAFFTKVCPSDLLLSGEGGGGGGRTWNGKVHAMIKFQRSGTYEKGDMRLTLKTD